MLKGVWETQTSFAKTKQKLMSGGYIYCKYQSLFINKIVIKNITFFNFNFI